MHRLSRLPQRPLHTLRAWRLALAVATMFGVSLLVVQSGAAPAAHAATTGFLPFEQGYYVTNWSGHSWLCYGWQTGVYRCTAQWHRDAAGTPVSDHPGWVPNGLRGLSVPARPAPKPSSAAHTTGQSHPTQSGAHGGSGGGGSGSGGSWQGSVPDLIRSVFGSYASGALAVARCESGFNARAYNPSSGASGVFQFLASTWGTTSYAGYSRFNAWANVHAAHQVFVRDGYSWREWSCRP